MSQVDFTNSCNTYFTKKGTLNYNDLGSLYNDLVSLQTKKVFTFCMFYINWFSKKYPISKFALDDKDYGFKLLLNLIMQLNNAFLITLRINLISTINYLNSTKTTSRRCIECMWFTWLTWHDIPYLWHIWSKNKNTNIITEAKPNQNWDDSLEALTDAQWIHLIIYWIITGVNQDQWKSA